LSLLVDFVVDANFFISSFSKYPARLATLREICEAHNYNLFTSDFILRELRRYIQTEVRKYVEIVKVSRNEIKELLKDPIDKKSLPQIPDLSLIIAAKKLGKAVIVSSDFKLLETAKQVGVKGLMGSAWLLELYEKTRGSMLRRVLKIMRDDVDPSSSVESQISEALRIMRSKVDKKTTGGEVIIAKGGDYIKDLL